MKYPSIWPPARILSAAAFLLLICCLPAWAAAPATTGTPAADLTEMSLEQLLTLEVAEVYSASRFKQSVTEAPASVTIITSDDIKRFGYRTLADATSGVEFVGRLATYKYYNKDQVVGQALAAFNRLAGRSSQVA